MTSSAILRDASGAAVPFLGAHVEAVIGDAMATTRVTQRYRNREPKPIEVVYTFPLPDRAVLLGFDIKLGDRQLAGRIVEAVSAARQYEEAVGAGDSAVLVQSLGQGLFAASIGNLMPGEEAAITFRYAVENRWDDGRLSWRLPTVIAPRYGDSGLLAEQEPVTDTAADHRLTISIAVEGAAASAAITSPSHAIDVAHVDGRAIVRLPRGEIAMDRDIILSLAHSRVVSTAQAAADGDGVLVWASFIPTTEAWSSDTAAVLDIVLDCSGSMQGSSISVARQALERIVAGLKPRDRFNVIRFGSEVEALFPARVAATGQALADAEAALRTVQADMGGTEIGAALRRVWQGGGERGDVILITDGHVHNGNAMIAEAKAAGSRIFTIGVGSQVQESLVRGLAEATGGAVELVAPGEAMAEAIARQFRRIKAGAVGAVSLAWETPPVEPPAPPRSLFAGDTVHIAARFKSRPQGAVTLTATRADGRPISARLDLGRADWLDGEAGATLVRIEAARRLEAIASDWRRCESGPERDALARKGLAIALAHGLMSPWTGMIVVRENAEKSTEAPSTRIVAQMSPAGMDMVAASRGAAPVMAQMAYSMAPPSARSHVGSAFGGSPGWLSRLRSLGQPKPGQSGSPRASPDAGSPSGIARQRFVVRLRSYLRKRGMPHRIDDLVELRLEAALETLLRRLARTHKEADVVRAFVRLLTDGSVPAGEAPERLVEALRAGL